MSDREVLEVDVLIVGGGPAGLSAALRLAALQRTNGGDPLSVAVLEKGRAAGAHSLSGAILDPSALVDLLPDFAERGAPVSCAVRRDDLVVLTARRALRSPITPPPLTNHGAFVISLSEFVKWLAVQVEAAGVDLFTGFAAAEIIRDGARVGGVRLADRGRDRSGRPTSLYEPGAEIRAKVTILCDGVRGNLTKTLVRDLHLDEGRLPQTYALGLKELWELPAGRLEAGTVIHTIGHPLGLHQFGGGFLYGMTGGFASVGLVCGLDYRDPLFDPFVAFQRFKQHPFVSSLLDGGAMVRYGAKALPEGGWHAMPRLWTDGALIAGDAGGCLNSLRLKGIHLAMRTGMLAAETAFEAIRFGDTSGARLRRYQDAIETGGVRRELYPVRNVHQAFEHGLLFGLAFSALSLVTGGRWVRDPMPARAGHERMETLVEHLGTQFSLADQPGEPLTIDRRRTFDRVTSVHHSGTRHREDQPPHLIIADTDICRTRCRAEYGNPCTRFCPANVYEMVDDGQGGQRLHLNPSNCVHCKACDIMDPYQIIDWVTPEGGDGPQYGGAVTLSRRKRLKAAAIAAVGMPIIEALGATYHWRERGTDTLDRLAREGRQPIFAFWHGRILSATLYFRDRGIVVITSENFDGEWIARIIRRFGYETARGSTSRGGGRALVQLRRDMKTGHPAAFTIDGPRGPARVAQPGAVWLASATGHPIVPFHVEAASFWTARSWDHHQVPKPGAEIAIAIGAPIDVPPRADEAKIEAGRRELERALTRLEEQARTMLAPH